MLVEREYLYNLIYKNTCAYYYNNLSKNETLFKRFDHTPITYHSPILDTNQFYGFKLDRLSKIGSQDSFIFYSYWISMASYYWNRHSGSDIEGFSSVDYLPHIMEKGIVGLNTRNKYPKFILVSGYMFLDDVKNLFLSNLSKENLIGYVKIRYYNYDPYDMKVKRRSVIFKSKGLLPDGSEFTFKVRFRNTKKGIIETFLPYKN